MTIDKAKAILEAAGKQVRCPHEGETVATEAIAYYQYSLAAAAMFVGSAICHGHKRAEWMMERAAKFESMA